MKSLNKYKIPHLKQNIWKIPNLRNNWNSMTKESNEIWLVHYIIDELYIRKLSRAETYRFKFLKYKI